VSDELYFSGVETFWPTPLYKASMYIVRAFFFTRSGAGGPDDLGKLAPEARMTTISVTGGPVTGTGGPGDYKIWHRGSGRPW
jgi:hypothetical protein